MKSFLFIATLGILLVTSLLNIFIPEGADISAEASSYKRFEEVIVEPGDTVWAIASKYSKTEHSGMEEMVERITDYNGLSQYRIYPGQVVKVPLTADH